MITITPDILKKGDEMVFCDGTVRKRQILLPDSYNKCLESCLYLSPKQMLKKYGVDEFSAKLYYNWRTGGYTKQDGKPNIQWVLRSKSTTHFASSINELRQLIKDIKARKVKFK